MGGSVQIKIRTGESQQDPRSRGCRQGPGSRLTGRPSVRWSRILTRDRPPPRRRDQAVVRVNTSIVSLSEQVCLLGEECESVGECVSVACA